jgi:hypothetical protein
MIQKHLNCLESLLVLIYRRCAIKVFFATKFSELQQEQRILVSMGCVAENRSTFYAEIYNYDSRLVQSIPWSKDKIATDIERPISSDTDVRGTREQVAAAMAWWCGQLGEIVEMWSDSPAVDWIMFCELFGGAAYIPKNVLYPPFDLNTLFKVKRPMCCGLPKC